MAVLTKGAYNCACSREVCDWTCTTYATMMSDLVPNTAPQPFKNLSKPFKSNADRIRAMSDEELAEWFIKIQDDVADYYDGGHAVAPELPTMKDSWLYWLKQEAES